MLWKHQTSIFTFTFHNKKIGNWNCRKRIQEVRVDFSLKWAFHNPARPKKILEAPWKPDACYHDTSLPAMPAPQRVSMDPTKPLERSSGTAPTELQTTAFCRQSSTCPAWNCQEAELEASTEGVAKLRQKTWTWQSENSPFDFSSSEKLSNSTMCPTTRDAKEKRVSSKGRNQGTAWESAPHPWGLQEDPSSLGCCSPPFGHGQLAVAKQSAIHGSNQWVAVRPCTCMLKCSKKACQSLVASKTSTCISVATSGLTWCVM